MAAVCENSKLGCSETNNAAQNILHITEARVLYSVVSWSCQGWTRLIHSCFVSACLHSFYSVTCTVKDKYGRDWRTPSIVSCSRLYCTFLSPSFWHKLVSVLPPNGPGSCRCFCQSQPLWSWLLQHQYFVVKHLCELLAVQVLMQKYTNSLITDLQISVAVRVFRGQMRVRQWTQSNGQFVPARLVLLQCRTEIEIQHARELHVELLMLEWFCNSRMWIFMRDECWGWQLCSSSDEMRRQVEVNTPLSNHSEHLLSVTATLQRCKQASLSLPPRAAVVRQQALASLPQTKNGEGWMCGSGIRAVPPASASVDTNSTLTAGTVLWSSLMKMLHVWKWYYVSRNISEANSCVEWPLSCPPPCVQGPY